MAQIVINEYSKNYTYNIGATSFATVALPITACWGPGYFDPATEFSITVTGSNGNAVVGSNGATVVGAAAADVTSEAKQKMLENTVWQRFPATQEGLEAFVATYRGPASCFRSAKDFSYQMAVTLLTAGYDILVCRLCPGSHAQGLLTQNKSTTPSEVAGTITFKAKYPGSFGNSLQIVMKKASYLDAVTKTRKYFWTAITYVIDASGVKSSVENKSFVFNPDSASDSVPYYKDVESDFWIITATGSIEESESASIPHDNSDPVNYYVRLAGGTDYNDSYTAADIINGNATTGPVHSIFEVAKGRYDWAKEYQNLTDKNDYYIDALKSLISTPGAQESDPLVPLLDNYSMCVAYYKEWLYTNLVGDDSEYSGEFVGGVYDLLKDKLAYNPQRVISPGWDDQDITPYTDDIEDIFDAVTGTYPNPTADSTDGTCTVPISPMHAKIMEVAYYGRCATGFIDTPKIVDRRYVHIEDEFNESRQGYIQKLARMTTKDSAFDVDGTLFHTHSAFFAPWGQFTYVGTTKQNEASPSFLALMIQRAQILNQPIQYEWALPTDRKHNLRIGKMEYTVPKKVLDKWQKLEGASVNVITTIPDLGTNLWGNSTLFEVPPATYQALANLSTRYLVNAVEDVAYRCGIDITFQYNNSQAYNKFYAGVTPILDTMKDVGAIEDYRVTMSADINGEDHVNANSVIGKIWLIVNGVINDIYVDLIALPAGLGIDLNSLS